MFPCVKITVTAVYFTVIQLPFRRRHELWGGGCYLSRPLPLPPHSEPFSSLDVYSVCHVRWKNNLSSLKNLTDLYFLIY